MALVSECAGDKQDLRRRTVDDALQVKMHTAQDLATDQTHEVELNHVFSPLKIHKKNI